LAKLIQIAALIYWTAVASVPIAVFLVIRNFKADIGCPLSGDCYEPGSEHLLYFEMLFLYAAVILLPGAAWQILRTARALVRGRRDS
jgi:hypothetical protein